MQCSSHMSDVPSTNVRVWRSNNQMSLSMAHYKIGRRRRHQPPATLDSSSVLLTSHPTQTLRQTDNERIPLFSASLSVLWKDFFKWVDEYRYFTCLYDSIGLGALLWGSFCSKSKIQLPNFPNKRSPLRARSFFFPSNVKVMMKRWSTFSLEGGRKELGRCQKYSANGTVLHRVSVLPSVVYVFDFA